MMKRFLHILLLVLTLSPVAPALAQNPTPHNDARPPHHRPAFSPEEFIRKKNEYITEHAKLTAQQANFVCPLLNKMRDELRNLDNEFMKIYSSTKDNEVSEEDSKKAINRIDELLVKKAELERSYHKKMLKGISAQVLLRVLQVEGEFNMTIMRDLFWNKNKGRRPRGHAGEDK